MLLPNCWAVETTSNINYCYEDAQVTKLEKVAIFYAMPKKDTKVKFCDKVIPVAA